MQTIVIYFDEPGKFDYPFHDSMYVESYREFSKYCAERDTLVFFTRADSYLGNMTFSHGWRFQEDELVDVNETITADLIYVKGLNFVLQTGRNDLVVNDPEFDHIARDKWLTYQKFHQFMPATYAITNENWQEVASKITTDKIVLKPILGSGGKGIVICDTSSFDFPSLQLDVPYIAQDFVDSSSGIPGLCDGYHDLRVILFNGIPKFSYLRMPKPGSLLSNISQGASAKVVDISDVPEQILTMSRKIDEAYAHYNPRIYTTDFFMSNGKAYLVETNTRPGFPRTDSEGPAFIKQFHQELFTLLSQAIAQHKAQA